MQRSEAVLRSVPAGWAGCGTLWLGLEHWRRLVRGSGCWREQRRRSPRWRPQRESPRISCWRWSSPAGWLGPAEGAYFHQFQTDTSERTPDIRTAIIPPSEGAPCPRDLTGSTQQSQTWQSPRVPPQTEGRCHQDHPDERSDPEREMCSKSLHLIT